MRANEEEQQSWLRVTLIALKVHLMNVEVRYWKVFMHDCQGTGTN